MECALCNDSAGHCPVHMPLVKRLLVVIENFIEAHERAARWANCNCLCCHNGRIIIASTRHEERGDGLATDGEIVAHEGEETQEE